MDMWLSLIVAFFGGGIVSGLIGAWANARRQRTARRADFLRRQLRDLYGPLQFLATTTGGLFKHADRLAEVYNKEYVDGASDSTTETIHGVGPRKEAATEVHDAYVALALRNTDSTAELLERNYALVDPGDAEVFAAFLVDVMRRKAQTDADGISQLPYVLTSQLDGPLFMSHEFREAVRFRFNEKRSELARLEGRGGS